MPRKLFIGGLSWDTTNESLRAAFESFGTVEEAVVVTDAATGKSRGFGFVRYGSEEEAQEALQGMNGVELDGRRLRVDMARDDGRRGPGGPGGERRSFDRRPPSGPPPSRGGQGDRSGGARGGRGGRRFDDDFDDEPRGGDPKLRGTKRW